MKTSKYTFASLKISQSDVKSLTFNKIFLIYNLLMSYFNPNRFKG